MFFTQVSSRYDALLKITKDIIILNPNDRNRRAFVCIFAKEDFETAFYRELDTTEISILSGMVIDQLLVC